MLKQSPWEEKWNWCTSEAEWLQSQEAWWTAKAFPRQLSLLGPQCFSTLPLFKNWKSVTDKRIVTHWEWGGFYMAEVPIDKAQHTQGRSIHTPPGPCWKAILYLNLVLLFRSGSVSLKASASIPHSHPNRAQEIHLPRRTCFLRKEPRNGKSLVI